MNEKPEGVWRKSWRGPFGVGFWFILATSLTAVLIGILIEFGVTSGTKSSHAGLWIALAIVSICVGLAAALASVLFLWFCHWKNFRRFLFGVGCFAALVALFYAEENWRGKREWGKFKHEQAAKGEKFTLIELAPPSVPDDQNFAMTPIVASCYSGKVDRNGRAIVPENTNIVNRLEMWAESTSFWATNASGRWQTALPTDLKAWQEYYRTLATKTNLFAVPAQPQSPAADVLFALNKYDATIEELRQASKLPYSRFPLEYDNEDSSAIFLYSHLVGVKGCVQTLKLRACAELQLGQTGKALADVKLILRLADSIRAEPILISHLVRIAIFQITLNAIWEGLMEHRWTDVQLAELDIELQKADFLSDWRLAMRGERAYAAGTIDYLRRHHELKETLLNFYLLGDKESAFDSMRSFSAFSYNLLPKGWACQNQLAIAKAHQQWLLPICAPENHLASPQIAHAGQQYVDTLRVWPWNFFVGSLLHRLSDSGQKFAHSQSAVDLARVACALERYRLVQGNYPDSLDALTPQFIAQIPHDVIGGQPLHYRRTDDGQFVLYSVGWNEKDDGGVVGLREKGSVDIEQGDWVWRYPPR